jgi:hypothetical protein
MPASDPVVCSNCWGPITLDAQTCPHCGFIFGQGALGAEYQRRLMGEPSLSTPKTADTSRTRSSLLTAGGFVACIAVMVLVSNTVPLIGLLIFATLYWASPFTWVWALVAGLDAPWPVEKAYLLPALAVPYPIVGLLIGFLLPFPFQSSAQVLRAVGIRFVSSLALLALIGFAVFMLAARK